MKKCNDDLRANHFCAVRVEAPCNPSFRGLRGLEGNVEGVGRGSVVVVEGGTQVWEFGAGAENFVVGKVVARASLGSRRETGGNQDGEDQDCIEGSGHLGLMDGEKGMAPFRF